MNLKTRFRDRVAVGVAVLLSCVVVGCATIMHGTTQGIGFSSTPSGASITAAQGNDAGGYRLPPAVNWEQIGAGNFPKAWRGLPLSLDGISAARLGDRDVLWIPVLMCEPELPVKLEALTLSPLDWNERKVFSRELGRRSIHFMKPGTTMLYGVAIDPSGFRREQIGVGFVVVTRLDEKHYDVVIESNSGEGLAAARGVIQLIDPSIGMGTLTPVENQAEVRQQYKTKWDLDPRKHAFPLFDKQ